jgi:hypothetical protein
VYANAPLLNKANANITPNPSKAPWYLMNLQELLLHMDPGLAGVTVPTVALIVLMAIPYIDRSNDGQGTWFGTVNSVRITAFTAVYSAFVISWSILWDDGAHVRLYTQIRQMIAGNNADAEGKQYKWIADYHVFGWLPGQAGNFMQQIWEFLFLRNRVAVRDNWAWSLPVPQSMQTGAGPHDGHLDWPQDFQNIPLPLNGTWLWRWGEPGWMPAWISHVYWYDSYLNLPDIMAVFIMPIVAIVTPMTVLLLVLWRLGWLKTVRDGWLAIFTGFMMVYISLTIIGAAFRGKGQNLVPPTHVPNLEENPAIQRQYVPPSNQFNIPDPGSGRYG